MGFFLSFQRFFTSTYQPLTSQVKLSQHNHGYYRVCRKQKKHCEVSGEISIYLTGACLESLIFSIPVMPKFFPPAGMTLISKL